MFFKPVGSLQANTMMMDAGVCRRGGDGVTEGSSPLNENLAPGDVLINLAVTNKAQLFERIGKHLQRGYGVPSVEVIAALRRREQAGTTALGDGVAIPHARVRTLERIRILYVRPVVALDFDAPDGRLVSDLLVLMVPAPATQLHLDILAEAAALFSEREFRKALRRCREPTQVKQEFDHWLR